MGYYIDAWLNDGIPQLTIRDAQTGAVQLRWTRTGGMQADSEADHQQAAGRDLQCLFRELILLSCVDRIARPRGTERTMDADCRECPGYSRQTGFPLPSPDEQVCAENVVSLQAWRDKTHG